MVKKKRKSDLIRVLYFFYLQDEKIFFQIGPLSLHGRTGETSPSLSRTESLYTSSSSSCLFVRSLVHAILLDIRGDSARKPD